MKTIRELIVRMATDNAGWGCLRIRGELKKVGHRVAKTTIATTLKNNGIPPSPDRPTTWNKMQEVRWFVALPAAAAPPNCSCDGRPFAACPADAARTCAVCATRQPPTRPPAATHSQERHAAMRTQWCHWMSISFDTIQPNAFAVGA